MNDFIAKSSGTEKKKVNFENSSSTGADSDDSCATKTFAKPGAPSSTDSSSLTDVANGNDNLMKSFSFKKDRRRSSSLSEAEDDQLAKFRRESIKNYKGMGGVSWGSLSIGAWLKDEIMFNKLQDAITIRLQQEEEQKMGTDTTTGRYLFSPSKADDLLSNLDEPPSLVKQKKDVGESNLKTSSDAVEEQGLKQTFMGTQPTDHSNNGKQPLNFDANLHLKSQASYLPTLEQKYCKDYSCCGVSLPSLHDLLNHYEQSHVPGSQNTAPKSLVGSAAKSNPAGKQTATNQPNPAVPGKAVKCHSFAAGEKIDSLSSFNVFHNIENRLNLKTIGELLPNDDAVSSNKHFEKKDLKPCNPNQQDIKKQPFFTDDADDDNSEVVPKSDNNSIKMQKSYKSYSMSNLLDNYNEIKNTIIKETKRASTPPNQIEGFSFDGKKENNKERTASPQAISKPFSSAIMEQHRKIGVASMVENHKTSTESILEEAKALIGDVNAVSMRETKSLDINLTIKTNDELNLVAEKKETNLFNTNLVSHDVTKMNAHHHIDSHSLHSDLDMDALDEADLKVMAELGKITNDREHDEDDENLENHGDGNNDHQNNNDGTGDRNDDENDDVNDEDDEDQDDDDEDDEKDDADNEYGSGKPPLKKRKMNIKSVGIPDEPFMRSKKFIEEEDKPFRCPVIGCDKAYKNQNGLKYHRAHGHEGQILQENNDGTFSVINPETNLPFNEFVEFELDKPYRCEGCGRRYKNLNGLKYHKAHSTH